MKRTKTIGRFSVDAGIVLICDPCYIYGKEGLSDDFPKTWKEFIEKFVDHEEDSNSINFASGWPGLGIISSTGYGDGEYPVYAEYNDDGVIGKLIIDFNDWYSEEED